MSHARLTAAAAILLGLAFGFIAIRLLAIPGIMSAVLPDSPGMLNLLISDRLVRTALGAAVFGLTAGLVFFLCTWLFVRRPLASAAQQLRSVGSHGVDVPAAGMLDILSGITSLQRQLAPLRRQFVPGLAGLHASLDKPAGAFLSSDVLKNAAAPAWLTSGIAGALLLFALMALIWGVTTGANAQIVNQLDPSYGHAAGLLIGLKSGGIACLLALSGAFACQFLSAASRGLAGQTAEDFLSAVSASAHAPATPQTVHDQAVFDLAGGTPHIVAPDLKPFVDTLLSVQSVLSSKMVDIASSIKSQSEALHSYTTTLQEQEKRRDLKQTDQRLAETALMQETTNALQEIKSALVAVKSGQVGQSMMPNPALSQRLSSAMRSLRQATADQTEG
jgi:hypothetical protein